MLLIDHEKRLAYLFKFDKAAYGWHPNIDYRAEPDKSRMGKGEQGALIVSLIKARSASTGDSKRRILLKSSARVY